MLLPIELWEWLLGNNSTVTNNNESFSESLVVEENVVLRPMNLADGSALTTLSQVPDTGRVRIAPYYHLDAYTAFIALTANTTKVVAEVVNADEIIGAGLVIDIKKKNWGESVGSPQGFTITAHESQNLVWGVGKVS